MARFSLLASSRQVGRQGSWRLRSQPQPNAARPVSMRGLRNSLQTQSSKHSMTSCWISSLVTATGWKRRLPRRAAHLVAQSSPEPLVAFSLARVELLRKRLQRDFSRLCDHLLIFVGDVLHQRALQHVEAFIARILTFTPIDGSLEIKPGSVNRLGLEGQSRSFEFAVLKEMIEKGSFVAVEVAKA